MEIKAFRKVMHPGYPAPAPVQIFIVKEDNNMIIYLSFELGPGLHSIHIDTYSKSDREFKDELQDIIFRANNLMYEELEKEQLRECLQPYFQGIYMNMHILLGEHFQYIINRIDREIRENLDAYEHIAQEFDPGQFRDDRIEAIDLFRTIWNLISNKND